MTERPNPVTGKLRHQRPNVLWLWTITSHLLETFHVLEGWGFQPKTILTWAKRSIGLGKYLRGRTEHRIPAATSKPKLKLTNQSTVLQTPRREHSRKPNEFYEIVDEMFERPKLDYFGGESRQGGYSLTGLLWQMTEAGGGSKS